MTDYEQYQLRWMLDHGHSLAKLIGELTEYQKFSVENSSASVSDIFSEWQNDWGFDSELWACEKEWQECEGKVSNIDDGLLVRAKKLCENCGYDPEDIGCEILRASGFGVKRYITGGVTVRDSKNEIMYHHSG